MSDFSSLPSTWATAPLNVLAEINPKLGEVSFDDDLEVSFVPMAAVEAGTGRIDPSDTRKFSGVKKGYTPFAKGDVLFAKITPCMENGKMAIVPELRNGLGFGSTEFHVIRPLGGIDSRYLYYFVSSERFRRDAEHNMTGAVGQRRVPTAYLSGHSIPVPPAREQRRIVAKIEELFSELDKGVESLTVARKQLKIFQQAVLTNAFLGRLTGVASRNRLHTLRGADQSSQEKHPAGLRSLPSDWSWMKLGDVSDLITKGASPKWQGINYVDDTSQTLFVTSENVRDNYVDLTKPKFVENRINVEQQRSVLKQGDVLFNIVGASIGRAAIYDDNRRANVNQAVALIRITDNLIARYVSAFLNSSLGRSLYMDKRVEVARANLSLKDVASITVPMPARQNIVNVLSSIERVLSAVVRFESELEEQLSRCDHLRQSILKAAFSGQLVAQRRDDEPASVMLERIWQARATKGNGARKNNKNGKKEAA